MSRCPTPPEFQRAIDGLNRALIDFAEKMAELNAVLREMDPDRMKVDELVARATVEAIRERAMKPLP